MRVRKIAKQLKRHYRSVTGWGACSPYLFDDIMRFWGCPLY